MYQPRPAPQDPKDLPGYIASELQAIAQAGSDTVDSMQWSVLHVAPLKPREGMVARADGTDWNPGSGAGLYQYLSGSWTALAGGGVGGATNLAYTASATNGIVTSDTGTDATLPLATGTNAGLLAPADFTKLSNTSGTNTGNETAASIKTALGITTLSGSNTGDQTISITGDVTAAGSTGALTATVTKINGTALSGLATGILKNTTATGVPSIAAAGTDYVAPSGALGTPSSGTLTNCTGLPMTTGVTGILAGTNGGTGVNNSTRTITIAGNFATVGAFASTFTMTNTTTVTFPTTGTLATLAGTEALSSKTITGSSFAGSTVDLTGGVTALNATAPPASGSTAAFFVRASSTANLGVYFGSGAPTFSAAKGSLYVNTAATTTTTRLYINSSGSTTWATFTASA